jgi:outer membrane protein
MRQYPIHSIGVLSVAIGIAASTPCAAQTASASAKSWSLGAAAIWSASPYRDYDNKALPVPVIGYEGRHFFLRGIVLGYRLLGTDNSELAVIASPDPNRFLARDSDDPRLRRLSDRNVSGLAGLSWRLYGNWGIIQATAQKELTGHGGGEVADLGYEFPLREGRFTLTPGAGLTYSSSALNDYYYGIRAREVAGSGLAGYRPGAAASPYFKLGLVYNLTRSWLLIANYRLAVLPGTLKDSPMVDRDFTESYLAGVSYVF